MLDFGLPFPSFTVHKLLAVPFITILVHVVHRPGPRESIKAEGGGKSARGNCVGYVRPYASGA